MQRTETTPPRYTLDGVVPWGRSLDEYRRIFALSKADLSRRIIGVGDGPASFNAEMAAQGKQVVSVDPLYQFSRTQIRQRIDAVYHDVVDQLWPRLDEYVWTDFAAPDDLGRYRMRTMARFLDDYVDGQTAGRYLVGELPSLDFADGQFDIALCSHFLFLYSEQLTLEFHIAAILELCRIAQDVRIFPLTDLNCGQSPHVESVQSILHEQGYAAKLVHVDYEFQRGSTQMMRVMDIKNANE